jgi:DNA-binding FadR family transcriptional regulator
MSSQPMGPNQESDDLSDLRQYIAKMMLSGEERLPPERELAAILNQTRVRLRVALKQLAEEGLLWRGVGNGTYLGPRPLIFAQSTLASGVAAITNPPEVMEARLAVEPEIARMAAFRAKKSHLDELYLCIEKMKESGDVAEWLFWDKRLHRGLCQAAGNTMLLVVLEVIQNNMGRENMGGLLVYLKTGDNIAASTQEHLLIVDAVRARDAAGAAQAMKAHLNHVRRALFGDVGWPE